MWLFTAAKRVILIELGEFQAEPPQVSICSVSELIPYVNTNSSTFRTCLAELSCHKPQSSAVAQTKSTYLEKGPPMHSFTSDFVPTFIRVSNARFGLWNVCGEWVRSSGSYGNDSGRVENRLPIPWYCTDVRNREVCWGSNSCKPFTQRRNISDNESVWLKIPTQ